MSLATSTTTSIPPIHKPICLGYVLHELSVQVVRNMVRVGAREHIGAVVTEREGVRIDEEG